MCERESDDTRKSCTHSQERDADTAVAETTRTTDTMKVALGRPREIKVDNDVDRLNINTTSEQVTAD
jgi:hypothetical protein